MQVLTNGFPVDERAPIDDILGSIPDNISIPDDIKIPDNVKMEDVENVLRIIADIIFNNVSEDRICFLKKRFRKFKYFNLFITAK